MPGRQTLTQGVPAAGGSYPKKGGGRGAPDPTAAGLRSGTRKSHSVLEGQPGRGGSPLGLRFGDKPSFCPSGPWEGEGLTPCLPALPRTWLSETTPAQRQSRHQTPPLPAGRAGARSWPLLCPLPGDASACARSPASRRERRGVGVGRGSRAGAVRTRWGAARGSCVRSDCPLTPCPADSAAPCPWGTREGMGEAFLGLRQKTCICLRAVTPDPGACPPVAEAGALRSAHPHPQPGSWRRRFRGPRP